VDHDTLLASVRFAADGLAPAILQDAASGEVLMLAYVNAEALARTLASGEAHFWSRSRGELWHKGATSGNVQRVLRVQLDCDHDAVLMSVEPAGPACHTGALSCFGEAASGGATAAP
jgi:phosphoribosyl-AMP cyclohydrolase